ncbi:GntR family transcriptional regulator [Sulfitobacter sp. HNIBRBA3233]|uniref:GntR family transcriptional regulator n=1 Tax=Sulfitobacter marinivivus TaxID=3158558 RepID=UPI0032DF2D56
MSRPASLGQRPLYQVITDVLRRNIAMGRLPTGLVLIEGPIARRMGTSRAPVQGALRQLAEEGLIHRFRGRGYLVGPAESAPEPLRRDLAEFKLDMPDSAKVALEVRGTWLRVYDQVEREIAACQIFGEYRVIETELADYLGVSRTVARDVLSRLNERGLVRKGAGAHWLAGPLTARALREKYQLRGIVEPAALRLASDHLEPGEIADIRAKIGDGSMDSSEALEDAFLRSCLDRAPNATLVQIIRNNRLLLSSVDKALSDLGLPADSIAIEQYRTLFDLIGSRQIDSAAEYLHEHLRMVTHKSLARLKIVALVPEIESLPRYLSEVE